MVDSLPVPMGARADVSFLLETLSAIGIAQQNDEGHNRISFRTSLGDRPIEIEILDRAASSICRATGGSKKTRQRALSALLMTMEQNWDKCVQEALASLTPQNNSRTTPQLLMLERSAFYDSVWLPHDEQRPASGSYLLHPIG